VTTKPPRNPDETAMIQRDPYRTLGVVALAAAFTMLDPSMTS
jgi:hypothetical protein